MKGKPIFCSGCQNKVPQARGFDNRHLFSPSPRGQKPRMQVGRLGFSRPVSGTHRWPPSRWGPVGFSLPPCRHVWGPFLCSRFLFRHTTSCRPRYLPTASLQHDDLHKDSVSKHGRIWTGWELGFQHVRWEGTQFNP